MHLTERGEYTLPKRPSEPLTDSGLPESSLLRTQSGISMAGPINRRLVEGVSPQLDLHPVFLEDADLSRPERIASVGLDFSGK